MPIFLERFVLPCLATLLAGGIVINQMKLDWHQRVSLGIATIALAYFAGHTLYKKSAIARPAPPTSIPGESVPGNIRMESHGDNSPNVLNNQGSVTINAPDKEKKQ